MRLDGHGAGAELAASHVFQGGGRIPVRWLGPVGGDFAIDADGDVFAFHLDAVVEPLVIIDGGGVHDVFDGVKAAGFLGIFVGGAVDLAFEAFFRPTGFLECGVDVEARVGAGHVLHFTFELKVGEVGFAIWPHVKEVAAAIADFDDAVFDRKAAGGFFIGFPTGEVFAIEHGNPAVILGGGSGFGGGGRGCGFFIRRFAGGQPQKEGQRGELVEFHGGGGLTRWWSGWQLTREGGFRRIQADLPGHQSFT